MGDLMLVLMCSVISYGSVEIVKPLLKKRVRDRGLYHSFLRLLSAIVGGFMGHELGWLGWHMWLGVGSGMLNSWVVAVLKEKVESKLGVDVDDEGEK